MASIGCITIQDIPWAYFKCEGKLAFGYKDHAIVHYNGFYLIKERGEVVHVGLSMVECLEVAHTFVFDYHARQIVPSWEMPAN